MSARRICGVIGCDETAYSHGRCVHHFVKERNATLRFADDFRPHLAKPFYEAFLNGQTTYDISQTYRLAEHVVHRLIRAERGW